VLVKSILVATPKIFNFGSLCFDLQELLSLLAALAASASALFFIQSSCGFPKGGHSLGFTKNKRKQQ
jgi:hypothetical protein